MTAPAGGSAHDATVVTGPPESAPDASKASGVGMSTNPTGSPATDVHDGPDDARWINLRDVIGFLWTDASGVERMLAPDEVAVILPGGREV